MWNTEWAAKASEYFEKHQWSGMSGSIVAFYLGKMVSERGGPVGVGKGNNYLSMGDWAFQDVAGLERLDFLYFLRRWDGVPKAPFGLNNWNIKPSKAFYGMKYQSPGKYMHITLDEYDFSYSQLDGRTFSGTVFKNSVGGYIYGRDISFEYTKMHNVKWMGCNFRYGWFYKGFFGKCSFVDVDFTGADLVESIFKGVSFVRCNFTDANFKKSTFENTLWDKASKKSLEGAFNASVW